MMKNSKPLSGYRVLELGNYVAAPTCGRMLADWGAEVIKIETTFGDPWRSFGPTLRMPCKDDENPAWDIPNANKRGIALNLKIPEGLEICHKLLEKSDVFITNTRVAALKKLDLDYESLKVKYPKIVYALLTGFGEKGPDVNFPGFDPIAFFARSGFTADLVTPDAYPLYPPVAFGDITTGTMLFGGVCAALLDRERTGKGDKLSISLYGSAIWVSGIVMTSTSYGNKYPKERSEGLPVMIPYKCKDGEWINLAILEHERYWAALCKVLDRNDLIDDLRFNTANSVIEHKKELISIFEEEFATRNSAEWIERLREADIAHCKLTHFSDVAADEQAWANDFFYNFTFANGSKKPLPRTPIRSAETGPFPYQRAPILGEHTKDVLEELGYDSEQIKEMKNKKVVVIP